MGDMSSGPTGRREIICRTHHNADATACLWVCQPVETPSRQEWLCEGEGLFLVMLLVELLLHNDTRECLLANLNLKLCAELRIL